LVEAENPVLSHVGTRDGWSQWCNRLPETYAISVAGFSFPVEAARIEWQRQTQWDQR
jgi:hypothetical protein